MGWVIAILLALILVAMVSSNKAAADGVAKTIHMAVFAGGLFIAWMAFIGCCVWYYAEYPKAEWERITGMAISVLLPPFLIFLNWKKMWIVFTTDKKKAFINSGVFLLFLAGGWLIAFFYQELKHINENIGWTILITTIVFCVAVLSFRTASDKKPWREIWFGPPELDIPWQVLQREREAADEIENAEWKKLEPTWDELSDEQKEVHQAGKYARRVALDERLLALEAKLDEEYRIRGKQEAQLSVAKVLVWALVFSAFGLIGIAWDYGTAYAMQLPFVKGREWLAWGVVAGTIFLAGCTLIALADEVWKYVKK